PKGEGIKGVRTRARDPREPRIRLRSSATTVLRIRMVRAYPFRVRRKPASKSSRPWEGAGEGARVRRRFESLLSAGVAIFSEHSLERVLQQIVDSAREVVEARYAALGVLGPDRKTLSQFVTSGLSQTERERIGDLPRGRGLL